MHETPKERPGLALQVHYIITYIPSKHKDHHCKVNPKNFALYYLLPHKSMYISMNILPNQMNPTPKESLRCALRGCITTAYIALKHMDHHCKVPSKNFPHLTNPRISPWVFTQFERMEHQKKPSISSTMMHPQRGHAIQAHRSLLQSTFENFAHVISLHTQTPLYLCEFLPRFRREKDQKKALDKLYESVISFHTCHSTTWITIAMCIPKCVPSHACSHTSWYISVVIQPIQMNDIPKERPQWALRDCVNMTLWPLKPLHYYCITHSKIPPISSHHTNPSISPWGFTQLRRTKQH